LFSDPAILLTLGAALLGILAAVLLIGWVRSRDAGSEKMRTVAAAIAEGASAYLRRQLMAAVSIAVLLAIVLFFVYAGKPILALGFLAGAGCSLLAGFIGMKVAVMANVRTAQAAITSRHGALKVAFNGGAVTGLLVVGLALLVVTLFYALDPAHDVFNLTGLALGASLVSVFARLGGGIYTKAADMGADLAGKLEQKFDEDDPRNPAVIADNVGDNVGDCAGMAADVFETYAVSLIGALLIGSLILPECEGAILYPFVLGGISIVGALLGIGYINVVKGGNPSGTLFGGMIVSAIFSGILYWPATNRLLLQDAACVIPGGRSEYLWPAVIGLAVTAAVFLITNYYTSTQYRPVRSIAAASETGHATNIIAGLEVGQFSTALPVIVICAAIGASYWFAGLYGIALSVVSMLSMAGIVIALDAFGPITDNAGGIAVMGDAPPETRGVTDQLDAVGNTMKAVTKGYAIASAGLAALVLFGSYVEELRVHAAAEAVPVLSQAGEALEGVAGAAAPAATALAGIQFSLEDPRVIIGLFIGGLLPFLFTAFALGAVGRSAGAVIQEVRRQLSQYPGILAGTERADYGKAVDIVTKAALKEMIVPALLPVAATVLVAWLMGPIVLGGMLVGTIVTGLFVAITMTSAGGAWDNAKKYIEEGHHGGKGSPQHDAAVTGDTVGDPYKDTAGPAVNPMIKVVNVLAILLVQLF
jgi:K(+)-stimulated pyrophosphate-energized sodium pump